VRSYLEILKVVNVKLFIKSEPGFGRIRRINLEIMSELKYKELTEKIIGASMKVHSASGNGFQEVIYQRALEIELNEMNVPFNREFSMPVYYKNQQIGERRVDFFVDNKVSVELKAILSLEPVHFAQARNYLEAYNLEVGLLINFGSISLQFKRLQNPKFVSYPFPLNQ
jgi:GxxExxY protein